MRTLANKIMKEESDLTESNVVSLFVVPGGKGPPSDFWVLNQEIGSVFLARPKLATNGRRQKELFEFGVFKKIENTNAIQLVAKAPGQQPMLIWYDGVSFSNEMEKIATVSERDNQIIEAIQADFIEEMNELTGPSDIKKEEEHG